MGTCHLMLESAGERAQADAFGKLGVDEKCFNSCSSHRGDLVFNSAALIRIQFSVPLRVPAGAGQGKDCDAAGRMAPLCRSSPGRCEADPAPPHPCVLGPSPGPQEKPRLVHRSRQPLG